jgi:glycosyltransferase involved in cell wall biosynthesis
MDSTSNGIPTFSVIIPTHRRDDLLADAVSSVIGQTRDDWECLVVDDGGGTTFEPSDRRVRVVRRPSSGGPAAARNSGLAEAQGRYVTFLDDDDRYMPNRLELAAEGLARADVAICFTQWFTNGDAPPFEDDGDEDEDDGRRRMLEGRVEDVILDRTTPHLGATAVRTERALTFDESYGAVEDVDWWLRMSRAATVTTVPQVGCELRRHGGARRNETSVAGRLHHSEHLLDQHWDYFRTHRRAKAFRLTRMGLLARQSGRRRAAVRFHLRSLWTRPSSLGLTGVLRALPGAIRGRDRV